MTQIEILQELKKLTSTERLAVAEAVLRLLREDLQQRDQPSSKIVKQQLAKAAEALLPDYKPGGELTVFTALDSEDFCAKG